MAQTNRITPEPLPDTLPEDFSEWDEESSTAALPADSLGYGARGDVPAATERAQAAVTMMPTPRSAEKVKVLPSREPSEHDAEVDAFLKRLNEVNADLAPARRQEPVEAVQQWSPYPQSQGGAAVRQEPLPAADKGVEQELIEVFRSGYQKRGRTEQDEERQPKWGLIAGVSAGVVGVALAIAIPVVTRGRSTDVPHPAALPTKALGIEEGGSALKPSPAVPAKATTAATVTQPKPSAATEEASYSDDGTVQAPVSPDMMNQQLAAGSRLPQGVHEKAPVEGPPPSGFGVAGMDATSDNGATGPTFKGQSGVTVKPNTVIVSAGVAGGMLIRKTPPQYPSIAKSARVQGTVVVSATITKAGTVENLQVVSGPAMLRQAALDAVRSWKYKPYLLNNQPTEVQTTISVDFNL
jgi:protein TonB